MSYRRRGKGSLLPDDGRCTKYSMTGNGRCPNDVVDGGILCASCLVDRKAWGGRLRVKLRTSDDGEKLPTIAAPLPAWMSDPSLLPKRPPGR